MCSTSVSYQQILWIIMQNKHIFLAVLATAIWGFNFIFITIALYDLPPCLLVTLRFVLSAFPIVFFLPKPAAPFKAIVGYGLLMFGIQFSLVFEGIHAGMPPGLTALVFQCQVFFSLLLAVIFLGETPTRLQMLGAVISFTGLGLVWVNFTATASWVGLLCVIVAAASMGGGNLMSRKLSHVNAYSLVAWGNLVSIPLAAVASLFLEGPELIWHSLTHVSGITMGALAFIVYISTWIGYSIWSKLLCTYSVALVIPFTLLVPVFGMLSAYFIFEEPIQGWKFLAACLIILGLGINVLSGRLVAKRQKLAVSTALEEDEVESLTATANHS
ncbi:MAG: EamA family transporter [Gammaproteobacteria bacterium]|nr:EamA family transporter [Gammaproteobacteria bacterium]